METYRVLSDPVSELVEPSIPPWDLAPNCKESNNKKLSSEVENLRSKRKWEWERDLTSISIVFVCAQFDGKKGFFLFMLFLEGSSWDVSPFSGKHKQCKLHLDPRDYWVGPGNRSDDPIVKRVELRLDPSKIRTWPRQAHALFEPELQSSNNKNIMIVMKQYTF